MKETENKIEAAEQPKVMEAAASALGGDMLDTTSNNEDPPRTDPGPPDIMVEK